MVLLPESGLHSLNASLPWRVAGAAHLDAISLHWVSVGDSPLFLVRDSRLCRVNEDHTMRAVLELEVEQGRLRPEAAASDPRRNALLSAVTGDELGQIDLSADPHKL